MEQYTCPNTGCARSFLSIKGKNIHLSRCKKGEGTDNDKPPEVLCVNANQTCSNVTQPTSTDPNIVLEIEENNSNTFNNNASITPHYPSIEINPTQNVNRGQFFENINRSYEEIVHFRRNLFNIPSGQAGKEFINELSYWLRQFNSSSDLNSIALKAFMVLPTLILQKPSSKSKSKEHSECLKRRLSSWKSGEILNLLNETIVIQKRLISSKKARSFDDISRIFAKLVMEGKISAALKFLDAESSSGVLDLSNNVLEELKAKHPNAESVSEDCLLRGPLVNIPKYLYDSIDEQSVLTSALKTKGSAGPSGMDAELYRRILCSKSFSTAGKSLREEIAIFTKNLLLNAYNPSLLEPYVASRLIPLDKNPGIRPIGVGEVLRRIVGKIISTHANSDIREAAGPLQTCAGHNAGAESAIHAMRKAFENESSDAVLLIDAKNAFNCMNRLVALHNIQVLCPTIALYIINTYRSPSRLFIAGGGEILSMEGTTQGDPLAMPWYSINTVILINYLREKLPDVTQVWLADDAGSTSKIRALFLWYQALITEGKKYGYFVNGLKSWLILKSSSLSEEAQDVFQESVNITIDGKRHLGAVIGSDNYRKEYCDQLVQNWVGQIKVLCNIAKSQPQAAYSAFTKGFKSKFTYFLRTIENFENYVHPVDEIIGNTFLPTLFGLDTPFQDNYRMIMAQSPNNGGLGIPILAEESANQFKSSSLVTKVHVQSIIDQDMIMRTTDSDSNTAEVLKQMDHLNKTEQRKVTNDQILSSSPEDLKPLLEQLKDKGASSWLNAIPLKSQDLDLNKEEFQDALRMRYAVPLNDLPSKCACGEKFDVKHALVCAKGGFIAKRHNNIRDLFTVLLDKVCVDVENEPHLLPITNEIFQHKSANTKNEARLDIKADSFWRRGKTAFFDVRVTHVNSQTNANKTTSTIFREHEQAKKREYMERVLEVEHASFTPLIIGTNGGMGDECQRFVSALSSKLAEKQNEKYSDIISWLRIRLSIEVIRSTLLCVRGSRTPFRSRDRQIAEDFRLDNIESGVI